MMYIVAEEFVQAYGPLGSVNACTKWRARREVVEWLTSLVSRRFPEELSSTFSLLYNAVFFILFPGFLFFYDFRLN